LALGYKGKYCLLEQMPLRGKLMVRLLTAIAIFTVGGYLIGQAGWPTVWPWLVLWTLGFMIWLGLEQDRDLRNEESGERIGKR
jgi:hypothetical protein